jgi:NAD-dependent SIR2 family protein deacetylase
VAAMPVLTARNGGRVVIVNDAVTDQDEVADVLLRGRTDELLPSLARTVTDR